MLQEVEALLSEVGSQAVTDAIAPFLTDERRAKIERVLDARLGSLRCVVENLHDPHNGAACIRSMESMGLQNLHVVESAEPFHAASAITMGCDKWISISRHGTFADCKRELHQQGVRIYATLPGAPDSLSSLDVSHPIALVFGNERDGIRQETAAACDGTVSIPMHGFTQSFNLSVSVAVSIAELAARRREQLGRAGDLSEEERARLRARWYALSVRGASGIISRAVSE